MEYDIRLIRSGRRTLAIEIKSDLQIVVRAPYRASGKEIEKFVLDRADWLEKHLSRMRQRKAELESRSAELPLTMEDIRTLAEEATKVIPERVRHFAPIVGVTYGMITVRNQRTRWGSCSARGNLNFNCLLMKTPPEVLDYVVVHELCHRKEMNHSPRFWSEVERVLPEYKKARKWLKDNGGAIISSMTIN